MAIVRTRTITDTAKYKGKLHKIRIELQDRCAMALTGFNQCFKPKQDIFNEEYVLLMCAVGCSYPCSLFTAHSKRICHVLICSVPATCTIERPARTKLPKVSRMPTSCWHMVRPLDLKEYTWYTSYCLHLTTILVDPDKLQIKPTLPDSHALTASPISKIGANKRIKILIKLAYKYSLPCRLGLASTSGIFDSKKKPMHAMQWGTRMTQDDTKSIQAKKFESNCHWPRNNLLYHNYHVSVLQGCILSFS